MMITLSNNITELTSCGHKARSFVYVPLLSEYDSMQQAVTCFVSKTLEVRILHRQKEEEKYEIHRRLAQLHKPIHT